MFSIRGIVVAAFNSQKRTPLHSVFARKYYAQYKRNNLQKLLKLEADPF